MIYLTFNDSPSGIFQSQVVDVVELLRTLYPEKDIRLVSFISSRNYSRNKHKIKAMDPTALVLPMVPGLKRWRLNVWLLRLTGWFWNLKRHDLVLCRGPFATILATRYWSKESTIVYDARGAVAAEALEYGVFSGTGIESEIEKIEKDAINTAKRHLVVSNALMKHWKENYGFNGTAEIIPCSVGKRFEDERERTRIDFNFPQDAVIVAFAGTASGWHSQSTLYGILNQWLSIQQNIHVLMLSPDSVELQNFKSKFPQRIHTKWVDPSEVPSVLRVADYGLLLRDASVTNRVSSPVKFSEYLASGLKVIISPEIGDFSEFVVKYNCGIIMKDTIPLLSKPTRSDKEQCKSLARNYFSKSSEVIRDAYKRLAS